MDWMAATHFVDVDINSAPSPPNSNSDQKRNTVFRQAKAFPRCIFVLQWTGAGSNSLRSFNGIKRIETKFVAYKMKSTTPVGSIMLISFEDEVIFVANIQAQPPGQVFNVEVELSLASKDQRFSVLACSNCKQLFTRYNVRREIYCTSCHRSTHLIPRCQFEVAIKDNNGFATTIVSDEIAEKMLHLTSEEIYEICFVKSIFFIFSERNIITPKCGRSIERQDIQHSNEKAIYKKNGCNAKITHFVLPGETRCDYKPIASTTVNVTDAKKRTIEHLSSGEKEYPSMANKYNSSTHKHSMEMKNPPMKKN
ncbi:hypothetical protein MTR67_002549 [Solanum verrucosum]|uniref:Replication factor A C-terminal domain-containing protein n=1 Tax=Solanum verrucosum TaxID=315347 RepID=A0AAF0PQC3_SOLVR|nr:hypothetical protein MTR67_002549 [Solanum verrucosum]